MKGLRLFGFTMISTALLCAMAYAQGTAFTYQGFLRQNGIPVNGTVNLTFKLFTALTGGSQVGSTITRNSVPVTNGFFTVELDFGNVWDGNPRYLEIQVGSTVLSPRVKVNPTPYAVRAGTANPIGSAGGDLSGTYPNPTVARLLGRPLSTTAPTNGQVLKWNGTVWAPADDLRDAYWQANGTSIYYNNGNVGIGTGSPSSKLHIVYDSTGNSPTLRLQESGSSDFARIELSPVPPPNESSYRWHIAAKNEVFPVGTAPDELIFDLFHIWHSFTGNIVVINGEGQVGIGGNPWNIQPMARLAVSGNVFVNGGIWGQYPDIGAGVFGEATATTGATVGVHGEAVSPNGKGVYGRAPNYGVYGEATSTSGSYGVYGVGTFGVYGETTRSGGIAIFGRATGTIGVLGVSNTDGVYGASNGATGRGVVGGAAATTGTNYGVYGLTQSPNGYGVYGKKPAGGSGVGVYFENGLAGTGTKSFRMDHPLMPETHYLNHFCAEGPEPYNVYRGTVVLDERGEAWVQLPDYFEAINRDPTYLLTPIGASMPNLHVAIEVQANRFKIAGGVPRKKVSWEVKAIRNDLWIQQYGYQTEPEKPKEHQGKYLNPELYGQPEEKGIHYHPEPKLPDLPETPKP